MKGISQISCNTCAHLSPQSVRLSHCLLLFIWYPPPQTIYRISSLTAFFLVSLVRKFSVLFCPVD